MQRRHLMHWGAHAALTTATAGLIAPGASWAAKAEERNTVKPTAVLTRVVTPLGDLIIAVDPKVAPITVANYLAYVDAQQLDAASVYRIVTPANQAPTTRHKIEVVQWGLNLPDDRPPLRPAIVHETTQQTGLRHLDGTVSMARNGPGTASSEFFICINDQPALDFGGLRNPDGQGFAAFGQVVAGRRTLRQLYAKGQDADQYVKPPIAITSVRRVPESERAAALQLP